MKLVDTNVWLALVLSKHDFHSAARDWLATETSPKSIAFCRATQQSFLRLLTTKALMGQYGNPPLSNAEAWNLCERLLADSRISLVDEPAGLNAHWKTLGGCATASPKLWMDAYLAAFAIAGGHLLVTTDNDFKQFANLNCLILSNAKIPTQPDTAKPTDKA